MFTFKSQKQRLTFWFLTISIIPLLVTFSIAYLNQQEQIELQEVEKLTAIRDLKVREINNWLGNITNDIHVLSQNTRLVELEGYLNSDKPADGLKIKIDLVTKVFQRWVKGYDYTKEVFLINTWNGKIVLSTNIQSVDTYVYSETYFNDCVATGQIAIKDIYKDKMTGIPEMIFIATTAIISF